jgi:subtilisin family serine protease
LGNRGSWALKCARKGRGVKVAILDTGIDTAHEAFRGLKFTDCNVRNFTTGDKHDVHDDDGHGTHCAGTILGRDVNSTRIGVAPGVTDVLIAKVIGKNGGTFEAIADAVEWAHVRGAHILSMSLGVDFVAHLAALEAEGDMPPEQARSQALVDYGACIRLFDRLCEFVADRYNTHRGMLVVAAAGNESQRPCVYRKFYPGLSNDRIG